jgi:hypothetical protein
MRLLLLARPLLLGSALLVSLLAQAQTEPIKFGKIDPKDLSAAPFVGDSAASAVVLCDYGTTRFHLVGTDFQLITDRITRIKILKKSGYDAATVLIPLYHQSDNQEKLTGLRGFTYNLVNGQVQKTKLDASQTFTEERTSNLRVRKFTMPEVHEGSVVEYSYSVTSDFLFNFQDWTFQREIPVRWSEFRASIPEYFDYKMLLQGYYPLAARKQTENSAQYVMHTESELTPGMNAKDGGRTAGSTDVIVARVTDYQWAMQDVPAFRDEPFMTTANDYVARIDFEMAGTKFPGRPYRPVASTWEKINSDLLGDDNFGLQLERGNFLKPQMEALAAKYPDVAARTAAVREVIVGAVRYDGTDRYATTASLRRAYDAHRGTSADVNLLLIAALRDAGIPAQPVLLSTRHHGRINQNFPLVEKFNYVIALVPLADGKDLLVDATEPLLPCGMLPERCLSQTGRLITKKVADSRWVELNPGQRHVRYQQVQLALDAQGGLSGKVHDEFGGYAGADERDELLSLGDKKYQAQLLGVHPGWNIPKFAVAERDNPLKPLALDYEFAQAADGTTPLGTVYLSPLREFKTEQNPFRHGDRTFPVDFGMLHDETMVVNLSLPAGYELTELPKPAVVDLPEGGGRFLYSVTNLNGSVQLTSRLNLRKPVYTAEEYAHLREFYRLMLEKQGEKLIIKKKA